MRIFPREASRSRQGEKVRFALLHAKTAAATTWISAFVAFRHQK
jgi:hypothetical protein